VAATISGPAGHPGLTTNVAQSAGQATLSGLVLTLPSQLSADLPSLSRACPQATLDAGDCPATSVVGSATAASPLVATALTGPVRLVTVPGHLLPDLVVDLTGPLSLRLHVTTAVTGGRLTSTVVGLPDVPLSSFTLSLAPNGLLASTAATLCDGTPTLGATFTAHSGATWNASAVAARSCAATTGASTSALTASGSLTGTRAGGTPTLTVKVRGTKLRSLRVTVPQALKLYGKRLRAGGRALAGGKALSTKRTLPHTATTVTAKAAKAVSVIQLTLAKGALRRGSGLKAGKRLTLKLRVVDSAGKAHDLSLTITARR
jgi:hypothetical protein